MNEAPTTPSAGAEFAGREYKSKAVLLGLPLVHIASGGGYGIHYQRRVAKGWIAIGDIAFGVLFALGGVAVGGLAVAHEIAVGGGGFATHANDAVAKSYMENTLFFRAAQASMKYVQWMWVLALFPMWLMWRNRR